MNSNSFRHFYKYHFSENHQLWDLILPLSQAQFTHDFGYSHGSIRDQVVHMVSVDNTWFSGLLGLEIPEPLDPSNFSDRGTIRSHWDLVESRMRSYLDSLCDDMLADRPLHGGDKELLVWQVLLHVINHGTDHRAQLFRFLNDLGINTTSQDYIFYVYDNP